MDEGPSRLITLSSMVMLVLPPSTAIPMSVSAPVMVLSLIVRLEAVKINMPVDDATVSSTDRGPPKPATDHRIARESAAKRHRRRSAPRLSVQSRWEHIGRTDRAARHMHGRRPVSKKTTTVESSHNGVGDRYGAGRSGRRR